MTEALTFQPFQAPTLAVITPFGSPVMAALQPVSLDAPDFKQVLKNTLDRVDQLQQTAAQQQQAIDMGLSDDLSSAMVESQKASVAFSALVQVRNKLQQGFDDVMNSPI
ncbi:flagellar hook-basal body complex protein FliE [Pantoea eucrina]|uniref:Flagellar hook-basal body complex protein FliE n=1 Tax=Pantoea eucrina TaxID=472693 RepID=A0ABU5LBN3_9GAMM|nr:flagellar hook-basal body complex protein FliE [Pantoea eucrina]MDZ7277325.1 flagellar hook-basal body complex protein FliE [Pantoea eucrina]